MWVAIYILKIILIKFKRKLIAENIKKRLQHIKKILVEGELQGFNSYIKTKIKKEKK